MGLQFKVIDKGYNKFVAEIKNFDKNPSVKIGILEENADRSDGKCNVDLMARHEYGAGVPQRSVIRAVTDSNIDKIFYDTIVKRYDKIINRYKHSIKILKKTGYDKTIKRSSNVYGMLNETGKVMKTKFRERFSKKYLKPNAPFTIAKKGSDVPLVEYGDLKEAINYKIE